MKQRPNMISNKNTKCKVINQNLGSKCKVTKIINESKQKPNNSSMKHKQDSISLNKESETQDNYNDLVERLKNIIEINCNSEGKLDSVQFLIEDLLPLFIEEREKVLEEVKEIIKTYEVKSILKFRHELLSKINKLK